ncbi:hypothetical protein COH20_010338 [Aspergillus flavus]|nr:hypothetical protein COH21_012766 [Aspergillus flavus]RAQ76574.1 hypothetical protein COH20_010338 [Aspergillus flavus]
MASYHRVLEVFDRSVDDKTIECDCDIHPWEITIDGETWPGRIRLIAFVDVFFIISYSSNDRFMKGVIIYKDEIALRELNKLLPPNQNLQGKGDAPASQKPQEKGGSPPSQSSNVAVNGEEPDGFKFKKGSVFVVESLGHEIGMRTTFPTSLVRKYTIEINRPVNWALGRRMNRGLKRHTLTRMVQDVVRCGLITKGQLAGHVVGSLVAGGRWNDTISRSITSIGSGSSAQRQALANEKI